MPRSRKKPYNASDTSTKKKALDTDGSPVCSTSGETQLSRFAGTNDEGKSLVHGSVSSKKELLEDLLAWIADGKPLRAWCRQPGKPHFTTVYDWLNADEAMNLRFARARDDGYDELAEKALAIAFDRCSDQVEVTQRRLQIETILKLLAKWNPKKYGDRVDLGHEGGITLNVVTNVPRQ